MLLFVSSTLLAGACLQTAITYACPAQIMQKVVFINKPITEDLANNMIALSLYLDSLDRKRIYYWLNIPGGEVGGRHSNRLRRLQQQKMGYDPQEQQMNGWSLYFSFMPPE
eukprot:scaffold247110_cov23-Tisochrysis_lutea.AAC.1